MSLKRKVGKDSEVEEAQKRVTRSTTARTEPSGGANSPPPRKKCRNLGPQAETENKHCLQAPGRQRTYGRRATKPIYVQTRKKDLEDPEVDALNLGTDLLKPSRDVEPRKITRRRVILDSVEITTTRRANVNLTNEQRMPIISDLTTTTSKRSNLQTKGDSTLASDAQKKDTISKTERSPSEILEELPKYLPSHMHESLEQQKHAILNVLRKPPLLDDRTNNDTQTYISSANTVVLKQLDELLGGSIERGEGNSCLIVGPAGSGKTKVFEKAIKAYEEEHRPIVIRLNGHVQHTDRLAIREIARQVVKQTGSKVFESIDVDDDDNLFEDGSVDQIVGALPPPSHLPSLIAALPMLSRPVVVLLDAFNIFTEQPRQALLYCLLDTVQSCHAGSSSLSGLAVIGLTSRVDVINLLEKRVKSRFSHRILRTSGMRSAEEWLEILRQCLCTNMENSKETSKSEWCIVWERSVNSFLRDRTVRDTLKDLFGISRDLRCLLRVMTDAVVRLSVSSPYLTSGSLHHAMKSQRGKLHSTLLMKLDYPSLSLCIAAQHARTAGHDTFTFEMLHELFATQVRTSSAAPVMLGGGSIGMVNIGRRVLLGAFEELVELKIFTQATAHTTGLGKEFIKYRCAVEREDVKVAVDHIGQTSLKKWFSKAQ